MNQQQKIQRLIDERDEAQNANKDLKNSLATLANLAWRIAEACTKDVIEARRWAIHYRRKYRILLAMLENCEDEILEGESENAELRAGLVFYAIKNAKLTGTMRDADTPGTTTTSAARHEHLEGYPFCECGACQAAYNKPSPYIHAIGHLCKREECE